MTTAVGSGGGDTVDGDGDDTAEGGAGDTAEGGADDAGTERDPLRAFDTGRWVGVTGLAIALVGIGVVLRQPGTVLVGAAGVGYSVYARIGEAEEATLAVSRAVSDRTPEPGDELTVTVRARNTGDEPCLDLRLVDGVPPGLEVIDGPARVATALRPGTDVRLEYTVRASRGEHEWETMTAITRNPSGSRERTTDITTPTRIACTPELSAGSDLPLRDLTTMSNGRVATDVGGSGVEFYATREYRRGDPLKRVDWNRRARTGELATLDLREERAATVILLIDARTEAYVAPTRDADTAVEASVEAAGQAFTALLAAGDRVGIAVVGPRDCWLPPGTGTEHTVRGRETLATDPALAPTPPEDSFYRSLWFRRFQRRIPGNAQVLLFSPLADEYPAALARRLDAYGHLVTVLSPDATVATGGRGAGSGSGTSGPGSETTEPSAETTEPGRLLVALERRERLRDLRKAGIRVMEWDDRSFPVAVANANTRWSR
ncbi:putative repeat protein (TIGR01451 family) [Halorubrum alkaliphilum]|uniref:Putative repeat protein (TIGR01451 family) n=1 Tax=Halorubrum alkaliphilum TaxID=261290 RepID=A0A8T4GEL5_9EURY|nr:DUF58 domain-containing protein [Halorubrum alkaliphilum]MBP1922179.1 putative repeat protein (TIGR01451 family) [Halorubrum alkaliphilum]